MVPAVVVSVLCLAVALPVPSMGVAVLLMGLVLSGLVAQRVLSVSVGERVRPDLGGRGGA